MMKLHYLAFAVLSIVFAWSAVPSDGDTKLSTNVPEISKNRVLEVSTKVARTVYTQLEPITVEFKIKNVSDDPVRLSSAKNLYSRMLLDVIDSEGKPSQKTSYIASLESAGEPILRAPGGLGREDTLSGTIIANLARDMTIPGKYRVIVGVRYWDIKGKMGTAFSEGLNIEVLERPAEKK